MFAEAEWFVSQSGSDIDHMVGLTHQLIGNASNSSANGRQWQYNETDKQTVCEITTQHVGLINDLIDY